MVETGKPKKILFLITKSNWGGAQRYVYDLATNLPQYKYQTLVALGGNGELVSKLEQKNISVFKIPSLERNISISKELLSFFDIYKIIRRVRPDILHVNSSKAGGIGAFLGRLLGVKRVIYTAHGWAFNEDRSAVGKLILGFFHWLTIIFSHTTIVVSHTTKAQMEMFGTKRKLKVIHNGCEIKNLLDRKTARDELISIVPKLEKYRDDFWSVTIAELHPIKQHGITIEAIHELVKKDKSIRHIIIGDGDQKEYLDSKIKSLNLRDNVFLAEHVSDASKYLSAFDLFVLSSQSEALGYVIIEASIASLPIISSSVGGVPEVIENESSGILLPPGDVKELANAYHRLLSKPDLRKKLANGAHARAKFFRKKDKILETIAIYEN